MDIGTRDRAALNDSVFAGAVAGHAAEFTDFCLSALLQPAAAVLPVTLELAELRHKSGEAVLRAVITGYVLACRVTKTLGIENLRHMGIADHGIGPVFGAGTAAA